MLKRTLMAVIASTIGLVGIAACNGAGPADKGADSPTVARSSKPPAMTKTYDSTDKSFFPALVSFAGTLRKANTHKILVAAEAGCKHPHVLFSVTAYEDVGNNTFDDYMQNSTRLVALIQNENADCPSAGIHLPAGHVAVWTVTKGVSRFIDMGTGQGVGIGQLYRCTNATHPKMGDHALPKHIVDTCDHNKPPKDDPPETELTAAPTSRGDDVENKYAMWVGCSDTCCYTDPGYPRYRVLGDTMAIPSVRKGH